VPERGTGARLAPGPPGGRSTPIGGRLPRAHRGPAGAARETPKVSRWRPGSGPEGRTAGLGPAPPASAGAPARSGGAPGGPGERLPPRGGRTGHARSRGSGPPS